MSQTRSSRAAFAVENIKMMQVPRPPDGVVARFLALGDPTGIISDTMDELGIPFGVIGASVLRPTIPGRTMVGPALTLRTSTSALNRSRVRRARVNRWRSTSAQSGEKPGDVLVIQGVPNVSNFGRHVGADRQAPGRSRAIVEGGVRDNRTFARCRYPIWSTGHFADHRQVAAGSGRDQRGGRDLRRQGLGRRSRRRRRHRCLLHSARSHRGRAGSRREEGEV